MRHLLCLSIACLLISLSGCLISHNSDVSRSGRYVATTTLQQMKPGETTDDWTRAVIGDPTSIQKLDEGTELWKWGYSERKTSHGTVFLLFQSNETAQEESTVFAEFKNGVLVRWWQG